MRESGSSFKLRVESSRVKGEVTRRRETQITAFTPQSRIYVLIDPVYIEMCPKISIFLLKNAYFYCAKREKK